MTHPSATGHSSSATPCSRAQGRAWQRWTAAQAGVPEAPAAPSRPIRPRPARLCRLDLGLQRHLRHGIARNKQVPHSRLCGVGWGRAAHEAQGGVGWGGGLLPHNTVCIRCLYECVQATPCGQNRSRRHWPAGGGRLGAHQPNPACLTTIQPAGSRPRRVIHCCRRRGHHRCRRRRPPLPPPAAAAMYCPPAGTGRPTAS